MFLDKNILSQMSNSTRMEYIYYMYKCNIVLIFSITFYQMSLHLKAGGDEL